MAKGERRQKREKKGRGREEKANEWGKRRAFELWEVPS